MAASLFCRLGDEVVEELFGDDVFIGHCAAQCPACPHFKQVKLYPALCVRVVKFLDGLSLLLLFFPLLLLLPLLKKVEKESKALLSLMPLEMKLVELHILAKNHEKPSGRRTACGHPDRLHRQSQLLHPTLLPGKRVRLHRVVPDRNRSQSAHLPHKITQAQDSPPPRCRPHSRAPHHHMDILLSCKLGQHCGSSKRNLSCDQSSEWRMKS